MNQIAPSILLADLTKIEEAVNVIIKMKELAKKIDQS